MSTLSARFFSFVQGALFYETLHQTAVALLPHGEGKTWLDIGCGPGLLTRLAAQHGYTATGFDLDPEMVNRARVLAQHQNNPSQYETLGLYATALASHRADVVSAASLLAVLPNRTEALARLSSLLKPDGTLLLVETSTKMHPKAAWAWLKHHGFAHRGAILLLWAWTRRHGRAVDPRPHLPAGFSAQAIDIFEGMVTAWVIRRTP